MNLKKLHIILITDNTKQEYNLLGKCNKDIISYNESGTLKSNLILNLKEKTLVKENIDYKITLIFDKDNITTNEVYLKKEEKILKLELETIKYEVTNSKIEIKYKVLDSEEVIEYIIEIGE